MIFCFLYLRTKLNLRNICGFLLEIHMTCYIIKTYVKDKIISINIVVVGDCHLYNIRFFF